MTALALLAVTAALVVLLAVVFHLGVAAAVVGIVGVLATVPGAYLAWAALPPAARVPVRGRTAKLWKPAELGVHEVVGGGPVPPYVRRPHDELLRAVLDPVVPASRLVVVRGGSSTGKTRAAYEVVIAQLGDWKLDYPLDPGALKERLDAGIPARTVLWLGELRQYADADGGPAVLARLADLLQAEGHLVITTMWPEHWNTYTTASRANSGAADPAGTVGRLLERLPELKGQEPARIDPGRGGVIDVPERFTGAEMTAAASTGNAVLMEAAATAASAGQAGQVTQYLAGVRDLLDRYNGPGGNPYGQAIITAAMDAARLGHASLLPAALLQEAAIGYLTGPQRTKKIGSWWDTALIWAIYELRGAIRALQPISPASGTGVDGYQIADYLDQHSRRTRQDQLGPASLWDALAAHAASDSDLIRLGQAARDRGLYRHAAALWTTATARGSTEAATQLITHLRKVSPADTPRAAQWVVGHASLDDPWDVAALLEELRDTGDGDAARALLARDPAGHASLDYPQAVADLLGVLRAAGDGDATRTLATRAASHASLDDPQAVVDLLEALREAGEGDAFRTLATRAVSHASLDDSLDVAKLLQVLREAGEGDAFRTLATRAASQASLHDPAESAYLLWALRDAGDSDAARALLARDPAGHASLDYPQAVADLLVELRAAGNGDAARSLATRAASHASLDDPQAVARLLEALRQAGDGDAAGALLARALLARDPAGHASLDDPQAVADLLGVLRAAGDGDATRTLATRAAGHASLDDPGAVVDLLVQLQAAGAGDAFRTLAIRAASHVGRDDPGAVANLLGVLRAAGEGDAFRTLAIRAASHVGRDDPGAVANLLGVLRAAGEGDAFRTLAIRAASHVGLDDPGAVAKLLQVLREAGDGDAARALLARDPAGHASLDDRWDVAKLLVELRAAGDGDPARTLATGAANAGMFDLFLEGRPNEAVSYRFGREPGGTPSRSWRWQEPAS